MFDVFLFYTFSVIKQVPDFNRFQFLLSTASVRIEYTYTLNSSIIAPKILKNLNLTLRNER